MQNMLVKPAGKELRSNVAWSWAGTADAMPSGAWMWCGSASKSLCFAFAETSRGHLRYEAQPSRQGCLRLPSGTSSLAHCTLRALIWLGGDFLKQRPLKGSLRGASVSNAHWQAAVPLPSRAWCITCASAEAQLHQRPPAKLQALSQGAPLHRCRMIACWLAHLF